MEWSLALLGAMLFGRICVRWHDCGIACVCSASAGCLTGFGLSVLQTPSPMLAVGFFSGFAVLLLLDGEPEHPKRWLTEWRLTLRRLMPYSVSAALLAGLTEMPRILIPLACVLAVLSRLSWHPWTDTVRHGILLFLAAAIGMLAAPLCSAWSCVLRGMLCACCFYLSGYRCLPIAYRLFLDRNIIAVFLIFVFLICYYTNCIIPI